MEEFRRFDGVERMAFAKNRLFEEDSIILQFVIVATDARLGRQVLGMLRIDPDPIKLIYAPAKVCLHLLQSFPSGIVKVGEVEYDT
jgi:hypothetical protein